MMSLKTPPVNGQPAVTLETISNAWKGRQDRIQSARFTWTERETVTKGYLSNLVGSLPLGQQRLKDMGIQPGEVVPPQDITYDVPASLCLDGAKVRYTRDSRQWSAKQKAYVIEPSHMAFDGKIGKTFLPVGSSYAPWPQGTIQRRNPNANPLHLSPLVMTFRAFSSEMRVFDIETLELTGRRSMIDGKSCLELQRQSANHLLQLWVDPTRDYVMVRYLTTKGQRPSTKIDVSYRQDLGNGWIPEKWDVVMFDSDGKVRESTRAKMNKSQINESVEPEGFDIKFPPGTYVVDYSDPKAEINYIVKEGDNKRMILPNEMGASYQQIIDSSPGEALGKTKKPLLYWLVILAAVVTVTTAGILYYKKVIQRNHT
jgi:hypothetical protein